jgi:hypothetical protein
MDQSLEIANNQIIFNRAKAIMQNVCGELNDGDIKDLRGIFLKRTWKIEAKQLIKLREKLNLLIPDVALDLNIKATDIRKLESSKDFDSRDNMAAFLLSYYQLRLN